jgi:hypothetical protein
LRVTPPTVAAAVGGVYTCSMRIQRALTVAFLGTLAVSGCQCINDDNFGEIPQEPDAGPEEEIVPPVFPLKAGDSLTFRPIGGRTDDDANGGSDFAIQLAIDVKRVALNDDKRWEITADALYERTANAIPATAISRLALENVADFPALENSASIVAEGAVYTTDVPPALDSGFKPNNFPFFQGFLEGNSGDDGTVFNNAAASFREAILALDDQAEIDTQISVGKFEAFFRDGLNGDPMLHKLSASVHPMGFFCAWDEILIPYTEGMTRGQSSFAAAGTPPLAGILFNANLVRDGVNYSCSCFDNLCKTLSGTPRMCLDPTDPDAAPAACP